MTNKIYLTDTDVKNYTLGIIQQMAQDNYKPDVVLGFARGGLVLANFISQFYNIPMVAINKDTPFTYRVDYDNVLVADDINDTGNTLANFYSTYSNRFRSVKHAVIVNNTASPFEVEYMGYSYNKIDEPDWVVFPWEQWWVSPTSSAYS